MIEHTCRPVASENGYRPWRCRDCGTLWESLPPQPAPEPAPEFESESDQDRAQSIALIGLAVSVSLACLSTWVAGPALAAALAVPGVGCVVYLLWRILRE